MGKRQQRSRRGKSKLGVALDDDMLRHVVGGQATAPADEEARESRLLDEPAARLPGTDGDDGA